ncbi:MAG: SBBP repeat-containing protein, partial [Candidatus Binatia bacterium]
VDDTLGGDEDGFVVRLSADGDALDYSTYLGGSSGDEGYGIAVDAANRAYVTGDTESTDFPTINAPQEILGGGEDAFVARLSAGGDTLEYATYLGGSLIEEGFDIAVDTANRTYVIGRTSSANFPTVNALDGTLGDKFDAFVARLSADGETLEYATYLGGKDLEEGFGIAVDAASRAYVIGRTNSTDFPATANAVDTTLGGPADAFIARFSADGNALEYATYLGGSSQDAGRDIALDAANRATITGRTQSMNFPTVNAVQGTFGGFEDAFVARLSADGGTLEYATYLGGSKQDVGYGIGVDASGRAYVSGDTCSLNFPTVNALQETFGGGDEDVFVARLGEGMGTQPEGCLSLTVTGDCTVNGVAGQPCQGTAGNDTITGTTGADVIAGLGGNDVIKGKSGNDRLCGNEGQDTLGGDEGDDTLDGGAGTDTLKGDKGSDTCVNGEKVKQCEA